MKAYLEIPESIIKKELQILLVDDHPVVLEAYKNILINSTEAIEDSNIHLARSCDEAILKMNDASNNIPYDLIFFDIQLPASTDEKYQSGIDLALYARKIFPTAKIAILTMENENHRIRTILKTVQPHALLIKDEIDKNELLTALNSMLYNPPYFSATVISYLAKQISYPIEVLDTINRKILYYISKGLKTWEMKAYINLSVTEIRARKQQIRDILNIETTNEKDLIDEAKRRGYV